MTNGENLKIMFEIKQDENSSVMLFNSLVLLLHEYEFYKEQMGTGIPTTMDIDVINNMLEKAKNIIDLMKVEVLGYD